MNRFRKDGVSGLMAKPLLGKQSDKSKAALIRQYRAAGRKISEIVVLANVCRSTVNQVLARDRASQQQPTLDLPTASVAPETSYQPATAQSEMADEPGVVGQTAILLSQSDLSATEACEIIFGRWGSQENIFKYLLDQYDLDATVEYGEEELSPAITHPNPEYVRRQKQIAILTAKRNRLLGKLGVPLLKETLSEEQLRQALSQWTTKKEGKKALKLHQEIELLRAELTPLPPRVEARNSGFHRLKTEMKLLTIGIKLSAYHLETKLVDMVAPFYPNHAKEGRKLIVAALKSPGSIRLAPGQIRVQIARQSAPNRTRAIGKLCQTLNELKPVYPGTNLQIVFESPVH